ncbi:RDD family protein [Ralstonia pseudosolanacearum]|uniref:RDD family protein n=1 Tax=Ralstonia solanacearum TaxID=305 RepID=A0AA92EBY0_RALSL|nr:RDD family protein [Ralstonia pseudosolanacearum]QCX49132.1 RDD family protein [Ralstonia pseudosolanacearum]
MAATSPASPAASGGAIDASTAPPLRRRLAAMLYEGLLLFGVLFGATALFLVLRAIVPPLARTGDVGLQVWGFLVLGLYFVGFWRKRGQTLAMQTWRIRVVSADGAPVSLGQAIARYLLAWIWVAVAAGVIHVSGLSRWAGAGVALACVLAWAALAWLDPRRQFLHDRLAGTRLIRD